MDGAGAIVLNPPRPLDPRPEEAPRRVLWAALTCGGCGSPFTADPARVPCFATDLGNCPACGRCWDRRNRMRARLGLPAQGRPQCYPADYPQE